MPPENLAEPTVGRRDFVRSAGLLGIGVSSGGVVGTVAGRDTAPESSARTATAAVDEVVAFHGEHQGGVTERTPACLRFSAWDLTDDTRRGGRGAVADLLRSVSTCGETLTQGRWAPAQTGAADGLRPAGLTVTVGVGADLIGTRARIRWTQQGFLPSRDAATDPHVTSRNLMGQREGTDNPTGSRLELAVWVTSGPEWMIGGTYLVCRRIRMHLTHPSNNAGATMVRRSYSYDDGIDADGTADAGLFFQAFQTDPHRVFVPIQRRLAAHDRLGRFIRHESSAVFAVLPGAPAGGFVGQNLVAA